jgi:hypothetical protein
MAFGVAAVVPLLAGSLITCVGIWLFIAPHVLDSLYVFINRSGMSFWSALGVKITEVPNDGLDTIGYRIMRVGLPAIVVVSGVTLLTVAGTEFAR